MRLVKELKELNLSSINLIPRHLYHCEKLSTIKADLHLCGINQKSGLICRYLHQSEELSKIKANLLHLLIFQLLLLLKRGHLHKHHHLYYKLLVARIHHLLLFKIDILLREFRSIPTPFTLASFLRKLLSQKSPKIACRIK